MFEIFVEFIKNMLLTGAYQNEVFKDPLSKEDEELEVTVDNDNSFVVYILKSI